MASATGSIDASSVEETGFLNGGAMSSDWYDGHKVVAMPSSAFGGLSIREVVSSRNETLGAGRPRRSNSLGRQPMVRPGGRDIVQDVYDRMGVSYTRGINYEANQSGAAAGIGGGYEEANPNMVVQSTPSFSDNISDFSGSGFSNSYIPVNNAGKMKDKFSGKYRAAAAAATNTRSTPDRGRSRPANPAATGRMTEPRGRTADTREEAESEGRRRARSLSRGLSVRGTWPPPKDGRPMEDDTPVPQQSSTNYQVPVGSTNESSVIPPVQQPNIQVPKSPERPKSPVKRSHSFDSRPQYGGGRRSTSNIGGGMHNQYHTNANKMRPPVTAAYSMDMHSPRDEKKDNDDRSLLSESQADGTAATEESSPPASLPSVKDRISAFAGKSPPTTSSQRNPRRNTFAGPVPNYNKSAAPPPPPPKVDIYQRSSRYNEDTASSNYHPDDPETYDGEDGPGMEEDYSQQQGPPEPSNVPPSSAASAAAEAAIKYVRPSQMAKKAAASSTRHSTGNAKQSSLVNSYLSGIQSSSSSSVTGSTNPPAARSRSCFQQGAPMSDNSSSSNQNYPTDEMNTGAAGAGVVGHTMSDERSEGGRSSMSYSEPGNSVRKQSSMWRKPAASYNSNYAANSNSNPNYAANKGTEGNGVLNSPSAYSSSMKNNSNNGTSSMSAEMIEKMVDERVQVQLREVESRMEGLLRRWMDQMNNKITSRLDAMESSIKESMPDYPRHEI